MSKVLTLQSADPSLARPQDLPPLVVQIDDDRRQVVARLRGELDLATRERLADALEPHLGSNRRLVVDLSGVTFMDVSCLSVLIRAGNAVSESGGSLVVRNPSPMAHRLLSVAQMTNVLRTEIG